MRPRPTPRGWGLFAFGATLVVLGMLLGSVDLARIGMLAAVLVVGAGALVALSAPGRRGHRLDVRRRVIPHPLHAGELAEVTVDVHAQDAGSRVQLAGLRFAEQADSALSGGRTLRARVERSHGHVVVRYTVTAGRRGRWALGPLVATRGDPFGAVRAPSTLGGTDRVTVWPAVTALPAPGDVLVGEPDRVALGARTPSTDDAALRDYQEGDDLRRVHWRSSARRGVLLVRSDERAGMRPVTVLLDPPARPAAVEWSVSMAASAAVAMLDGGHPVRLVDVSVPGGPGGEPAAFVHARSGPTSRALLLDQLTDVAAPRSEAEAERRLLASLRMLASSDASGNLVVAVLGSLSGDARQALAEVTQTAHGWALVRADSPQAAEAAAAEQTIRALCQAGWRACRVTSGEPMLDAWQRLLRSTA